MNRLSINPTSQKQYILPKFHNDVENINNFLKQNNEKKVVVVQGLGFVGSVMSLVVANAFNLDFAVIGIDLPTESSYWKICSINEGVFPILTSDQNVEIFFNNTKSNKNLYATCDDYAYSVADVIVVDINLDVKKKYDNSNNLNYDVDLTSFKQAISNIANTRAIPLTPAASAPPLKIILITSITANVAVNTSAHSPLSPKWKSLPR